MEKGNTKSGVIRKGSMPLEEITKLAQELQPEVVKVVEAPKPEPVVKGEYKAFAMSIKAKLTDQETVELTGDFIKSLFPQVKCAGEVVKNLKRTYGLSYRRIEKGRNDTYVFFIEPTREELIVQLTSAESKAIELQKSFDNLYDSSISAYNSQEEKIKELQKDYQERYDRWGNDLEKLGEENSQLKSELSNEKIKTTISLLFAIICLIVTIGYQLTSQ